MQVAAERRTTIATIISILTVLYAISFFIGALLHADVRIPIGFTVLDEPQIIPATIVEGLCGIVLAVSAYAILTRKPWAWQSAVGAHIISIGGVLLGIAALAAGRGPRTNLNDTYHAVILTLLMATFAVLLTRSAKVALRHGNRRQRSA